MYFSVAYINTCARGHEHKCATSFIQQCIATHCFIPWINNFTNRVSDSTVHSDGLTCLVSIESAVLNDLFDMNVWMIQ